MENTARIAAFWGWIDMGGPDDCWLWCRGKSKAGYGALSDGKGSSTYAHRVAYSLIHGPIPAGMHVLHSCDVRLCCNPNHLRLGTNRDNMADKVVRGRQAMGDGHHSCKLTGADVLDIRAATADNRPGTVSRLARRYGVTTALISGIKYGRYWKHLGGASLRKTG